MAYLERETSEKKSEKNQELEHICCDLFNRDKIIGLRLCALNMI